MSHDHLHPWFQAFDNSGGYARDRGGVSFRNVDGRIVVALLNPTLSLDGRQIETSIDSSTVQTLLLE